MTNRVTGSTAIAVLMGAVILQVFVPVMFDLMISLVIGGACGWIGYKIGKS